MVEVDIIIPAALLEQMLAAYDNCTSRVLEDREIIATNISKQVAEAFANFVGHSAFEFEYNNKEIDDRGTLYFFRDPSKPHEAAAQRATVWIRDWVLVAGILSGTGVSDDLLSLIGSTTQQVVSGFAQPDGSLECYGKLTCIIEVAYGQTRRSVQAKMVRWTNPAGHNHVTIGFKLEYPAAESMEAYVQVPGQHAPTGSIQFGVRSKCVSPALYDYQLYLPVKTLLHGLPWWKQQLVNMALCVMVIAYSCLCGGMCASSDVLRGRRSLWEVVKCSVRAWQGPWWGVVPLDLFYVRKAVIKSRS
mmetsp:Transcript_899/g.1977  ORF Transcript_899/g.1977 Transcript_899/m.1977 type:complete len:303 (-) Transcript_899:2121-3029(-)